jgi:hypothetical protein
MKNNVALIILVICLCACTGKRQMAGLTLNDKTSGTDDTITYELLIIDPGFENWFLTYRKPLWYHSQTYLEMWNRRYVSAWNSKYLTGRNARFFESYIDYQPHIDYGLELNHKLFYYFQYVEKRLKIPVLPSGTGPMRN